LTFDTIGLAAFGIKFDTINGVSSPITSAIDGLFSCLNYRMIFGNLSYWKILPDSAELKKCRSVVVSQAREVIKHKQSTLKTNTYEKPDLLDMMLDPQNKVDLSVEDIVQEAIIFMVAGTETTATTLSFFFGCISQNLDIQDKIVAEIDQKIGRSEPTFENVKTLIYTEMCLKEAMRIYPVAFINGRQFDHNTVINGIPMKKDTKHLFLSIQMNHNPKYFTNPMKFDPDRWQTIEVKNLPQHVYSPFGGGLRVCVGKTLAWNEMLVTIVILLQKFRFTAINPEWPISYHPSFTLQPSKPISVAIEKR